MKVLVNGGLNLSELDGWWAEAYTPELGWALGDGREHGDDPAWDAIEANALYDLLEQQVVPEFYTRSPEGIPTAWVARMRESMAQLTPRYSTNRAVREYTERHYLPAAAEFRARRAANGATGRDLVDWEHAVQGHWNSMRFGARRVASGGGQHVVEVEVFLGEMQADAVRVELYADPLPGGDPVRQPMQLTSPATDRSRRCLYHATVPATRPAGDYTARVVPRHEGAAVPLECSHILWQG